MPPKNLPAGTAKALKDAISTSRRRTTPSTTSGSIRRVPSSKDSEKKRAKEKPNSSTTQNVPSSVASSADHGAGSASSAHRSPEDAELHISGDEKIPFPGIRLSAPETPTNTTFLEHIVLKDRVEFEEWPVFEQTRDFVKDKFGTSMQEMRRKSRHNYETHVRGGFLLCGAKLVEANDALRNKETREGFYDTETSITAIAKDTLDAVAKCGPYIIQSIPAPIVVQMREYFSPVDKRKVEVDYAVRRMTKDAGLLTALELKGPGRSLATNSWTPDESLADHYNRVFKNPEFRPNGSLVDSWFHYMIAQSLMQMMGTESGCGGIYTHNNLVCMKIVPKGNDKEDFRVMVSDLMRVHSTERNTIHGLVALLGMSLEKDEANIRRMRSGASTATRLASEEHYEHLKKQLKRKSGSSSQSSTPQRGSSSTAAGGRGRADLVTSPIDSDEEEERYFKDGDGDVEEEQALITKLLLIDFDEPIGEGGSGIVGLNWVHGRALAVKVWDQLTEFGRDCMRNEIRKYREIRDHHPELLGTVLPQLVASRTLAQLVLVTEYVGLPIKGYKEDGKQVVTVDGRVVSSEDVRELQAAGVRAIQALHQIGLTHRDIKYENVRAEKVPTVHGKMEWRVWITDLGTAVWNTHEQLLYYDEGFMRGLFIPEHSD